MKRVRVTIDAAVPAGEWRELQSDACRAFHAAATCCREGFTQNGLNGDSCPRCGRDLQDQIKKHAARCRVTDDEVLAILKILLEDGEYERPRVRLAIIEGERSTAPLELAK